jgi:type IV secretion system protein VirB9
MSDKNFKYSFNGMKDLAPNLIFDDGKQTFFKFSNNLNPVIYEVNENGEEILINLKLNNGYLVFNGTRKQFSIRSRGKLACIFNEK